MQLIKYSLKNFRRLENVTIELESNETIFVGPNNSGKTTAALAFRYFVLKSNPFSIHEFPACQLDVLNSFGAQEELKDLSFPNIEMELWFSVDPETEYGRIANLLTITSIEHASIGIRISLEVTDIEKMREEYTQSISVGDTDTVDFGKNTLTSYLSVPANFSRHFSLQYYSLESNGDKVLPKKLEKEDGSQVLRSLLHVDFVDAQRNIDDQEKGRGTRLSSALATFYQRNLEKPGISEIASKVIDKNNEELTDHYRSHFSDLLAVIKNLGIPAANDRDLKILSTLSPESALKGNTALHYVDAESQHELPEAYNGLGFKNLIYMAIQISHFHIQWMRTEESRPLCLVIIVEEPEVHLHAQVQQTFISNIWNIIQTEAKKAGEESCLPQFIVTTHSSHVVDEIAFEKIRYFRRCPSVVASTSSTAAKKASDVFSLRKFKCGKDEADDEEEENNNISFLRKYLKLTHCDLFFADAVVLVEGTVEKLLLPEMVKKSAPELQQKYLTILEVGGAYAHRFASLLDFIQIPYLVITDIDSSDPVNKKTPVRADTSDAVTSNASIKWFLKKHLVKDLMKLSIKDQIAGDGNYFVTFQKPTSVVGYGPGKKMYGRTFEECFVYENISAVRDASLIVPVSLESGLDFEKDYQKVFDTVRKKGFAKVEFALDVVSSNFDWNTPIYIKDGLGWLENRLK